MSLLLASLSIPAAFMAGLSASPHCCLMCGPLQAMALGRPRPGHSQLVLMQAGRVSGYALLGFAAGALGSIIAPVAISAGYGNALRTAAGIAAIVLGLHALRDSKPRCSSRVDSVSAAARHFQHGNALLAGMLWSFIPCVMLVGMLFLASTSADPLYAALLLAAFGFGTLPLLGLTGLLSRGGRASPALRKAGAVLLILLGIGGLYAVYAQSLAASAWCFSSVASSIFGSGR